MGWEWICSQPPQEQQESMPDRVKQSQNTARQLVQALTLVKT